MNGAGMYTMGGHQKDIIGSGSYGTVIKGKRQEDGLRVAMKRSPYCPVQGCPPSVLRECSSLRKLRGQKHVVQLLDVVMEDSFITLILPLYHSDLHTFITQHHPTGMPRALTRHFAGQILAGLLSCHENGIIHRDLKPGNILVNSADCSLVIADFGLARFSFVQDSPLTRDVVTLNYRPPELLRPPEQTSKETLEQIYAQTVDIWAFGCILYELRTGCMLFQSSDIELQMERLHSEHGPLQRLASTKRLREVVTCMLSIDPAHRPSTFTLMVSRYFQDE